MIYKVIDRASNHYKCECIVTKVQAFGQVRSRAYSVKFIKHSDTCLLKSETENRFWTNQIKDKIFLWLYT